MSTPLAFRTVVAVAVLAFAAGCLAAVAQAQDPAPAPAQRTLVAVGSGQAKVTPTDRNDNAAIVKAVETAETQALPRALADARAQAQQLATTAGVTLGPLLIISNTVATPFFGGYYPFGTFGPDQYCGRARTSKLVTGKDGKRRRVVETKRVCRFPNQVQRQVQLTYALA